MTRIPIKGGMTIPNIATFDHGIFVLWEFRCNTKPTVLKMKLLVPGLPKFCLDTVDDSAFPGSTT